MNELDELFQPLSTEGAQHGPPIGWIFARARRRQAHRRRLVGVAIAFAILAVGWPMWRWAATQEPEQVTTVGEDDSVDPSPPVGRGTEDGGGGPAATDAVEAEDQGFMRDESGSGELEALSYGVVVRNRSGQAAVGVKVEVLFMDTANDVRITADSVVISVLPPGQTFGVGRELRTARAGTVADDAIEMQVEVVGPVCWEPAGTGEVFVSDVTTRLLEGLSSVTTFQARSTFDQELEAPTSWAIYRDATGQILGGSQGTTASLPPGSTVTGEILSFVPMPSRDISRTEVSVDLWSFPTSVWDEDSPCPGPTSLNVALRFPKVL